jgi:hypothetical protein
VPAERLAPTARASRMAVIRPSRRGQRHVPEDRGLRAEPWAAGHIGCGIPWGTRAHKHPHESNPERGEPRCGSIGEGPGYRRRHGEPESRAEAGPSPARSGTPVTVGTPSAAEVTVGGIPPRVGSGRRR